MSVFLRTRPPLAGRAWLMALLVLCTLPLTLEAREAPTDATVLIRVRGTVRVAVALFPGAAPEVTERRDVEIATGSGFVVSADGYIVTNHHVVSENTFEIVLRAGRLSETRLDAAAAAGRCSPRRAAIGATSYLASTNWLGTSYVIEGVFLEHNQRLLHLQFVAPAAKAAAARGLLAAWVKQLSP